MGDTHQDIVMMQELAGLFGAGRQEFQDLAGDGALDIAHVIRAE